MASAAWHSFRIEVVNPDSPYPDPSFLSFPVSSESDAELIQIPTTLIISLRSMIHLSLARVNPLGIWYREMGALHLQVFTQQRAHIRRLESHRHWEVIVQNPDRDPSPRLYLGLPCCSLCPTASHEKVADCWNTWFLPGLGVCVSVGSRGIEVEILVDFGASVGLVEVFVAFF